MSPERQARKAASETSPWEVGGCDLLECIDRGLRLSARPGHPALPRPEDEREEAK